MKILIADDDSISRKILETAIRGWGYELTVTSDGAAAWEELQKPGAPELAVLDWMMPAMDGVELCRKVRGIPGGSLRYLLLVTSKDTKESIVEGLESGANDYVVKPYDLRELRARIRVGERMLELENKLALQVRELEEALAHVKRLQGMLPICAYCKKIRDDKNYWHQVEEYVGTHADVTFSHGICPTCKEKVMREIQAATGRPAGT